MRDACIPYEIELKNNAIVLENSCRESVYRYVTTNLNFLNALFLIKFIRALKDSLQSNKTQRSFTIPSLHKNKLFKEYSNEIWSFINKMEIVTHLF